MHLTYTSYEGVDSLCKSDDLSSILLLLFDGIDVEETRENLEQGHRNHIHDILRDGFKVCQSTIPPPIHRPVTGRSGYFYASCCFDKNGGSKINTRLGEVTTATVLKLATDMATRAFWTFDGLTSGIGIHYARPKITDATYRSIALESTNGSLTLPKLPSEPSTPNRKKIYARLTRNSRSYSSLGISRIPLRYNEHRSCLRPL